LRDRGANWRKVRACRSTDAADRTDKRLDDPRITLGLKLRDGAGVDHARWSF
jgi:hypothetical protein